MSAATRRRASPTAAPLAAAAALLLACAGTRPAVRPGATASATGAATSPEVNRPGGRPPPAPPGAPAALPPSASPPGAELPPCTGADGDALRAAALARARELLGHRPRLDCSGYVLLAYRAAGLSPALPPRRNRSQALRDAWPSVEAPRPGDLAFFRGTTGRQRRDGGGPITHVALVETVDGDQVTLLHRGARVERLRLDLAQPSDPARNDPVRARRRGDPAWMRYLAGELLSGFAAFPTAERPAEGADGPATCRP